MYFLGCLLFAGLLADEATYNRQHMQPDAMDQMDAPDPTDQHMRNQRVQLGGNYTYAWITPHGVETTRGSLGGAQLLYEYRPQNDLYAAAGLWYRNGSTDNDLTRRSLQDINPVARIGYTCSWMIDRLAFYTGFGGRYMQEPVKERGVRVVFDYTALYIPIGLSFEQHMGDWVSLGFNFQWSPQVFSVVHIAPLTGAQWGLTLQMINIYADLPLTFSFF